MNTTDALSPHEELARKFEQWQKDYYQEVETIFYREDKYAGLVAFDAWEGKFFAFLTKEAPRLLKVYRTDVNERRLIWRKGDGVYKSWKRSKGEAVEAFLARAIREARDIKIMNTSPNDSEELSPHEILARKFEQWQKEYMDDVNDAFLKADWHSGKISFDAWEQRFVTFLEHEATSLLPIYKTNVQMRAFTFSVFGASIIESWKGSKGEAIEAFLTMAIKQARAKKLISESNTIHVTGTPVAKHNADGKIFIGHGRSSVWKDLKDFLEDRLDLEWDEFNRESTAGHTTVDRLKRMLDEASFAFLVMTAEDEHGDQKLHARQNVIHEIGLFQGKLGFDKAIILLEEGCERFSNIDGLTYISFPKGNLESASEKIRRVLEREGILK